MYKEIILTVENYKEVEKLINKKLATPFCSQISIEIFMWFDCCKVKISCDKDNDIFMCFYDVDNLQIGGLTLPFENVKSVQVIIDDNLEGVNFIPIK